MKDRVLAFGCHPDDVEFNCVGTLIKLASLGYEIHIATMTGGEVGHPTLSVQEIRKQRLQEAARAAALVPAIYHYAGGCDLEVEFNSAYRKMAVRVMREVDPLIVFTTPPMDYLPDHEETSRLVRNAAFIGPVPNFDVGVPSQPTRRIPYLYYWDAASVRDIFGRPLPLRCSVNVTDVMELKTRTFACHESQREWLAHLNNWDNYLDNMKTQARLSGERAGCEYAEGFIQHVGLGHPWDNILKAVLGDSCIEYDLTTE